MNANVIGESGKAVTMMMGCYGPYMLELQNKNICVVN
jgi:topoisomerase IA-like protein